MLFLEHISKKILSYDQIEKAYLPYADAKSALNLLNGMLEDWNVGYDSNAFAKFETIHQQRQNQKTGLLIVANHPFGGIEGMLLSQMLLKIGFDLKVLANPILKNFTPLKEIFLFVSPYKDKASIAANITPSKKALKHLKSGGTLLMFPSGEVSSLNLRHGHIMDPKWSDSCQFFVEKSACDVLPVFVEGQNSKAFQALGLVHPKLRTLMLAKEILAKKNQNIKVQVGGMLSHASLLDYKTNFKNKKQFSDFIRFLSYSLFERKKNKNKKIKKQKKIISSDLKSNLEQELLSLDQTACLYSNKQFKVYVANKKQIPKIMLEIARQRELVFRQVGEGTGKAKDSDKFDAYYKHLFVWDHDKNNLVGAYRIAKVDEVLDAKKKLYSQTLFACTKDFFEQLGPAIELGRSFVALDYQKTVSPLALLWKGIGVYIGQNPHYSKLYGPVSISNDYSYLSRWAMRAFLMDKHSDKALSSLLNAKSPFAFRRFFDYQSKDLQRFFQSLGQVNTFIEFNEDNLKQVPILIKQYLKLGAKFLKFNVDKKFNNALDALIVVDLKKTDNKTLQNFMGKDLSEQFYGFHKMAKGKK